VTLPDGWAAARLLAKLVTDDVTGDDAGMLRELAVRLHGVDPAATPGLTGHDELVFAMRLHRFVKSAVRFQREQGEVFQTPRATLARRGGDCDDHARLIAALALAGGIPARIAFLHAPDGGPRHVTAQVHVGGGWQWLETTVDAAPFEHPLDAVQRLKVRGRDDVSRKYSEVTIMVPPLLEDPELEGLTSTTFDVSRGVWRMRLVADAQQAFADVAGDLAGWMLGLGFVNVRAYSAKSELPADWPAQERDDVAPGGFPRQVFWLQGEWTGEPATHPRDIVIPPATVLTSGLMQLALLRHAPPSAGKIGPSGRYQPRRSSSAFCSASASHASGGSSTTLSFRSFTGAIGRVHSG
jgi:hypothetical protein